MHHPSVQQLLSIGDNMLDALDAGDVDRFSELLERRGQQVRAVSEALDASGFAPADIEALGAQSARLEEAMRSTRTALGAAVSAVSRFRSARQTYQQRPAAVGGRLNKSLHG